jgi:transposase
VYVSTASGSPSGSSSGSVPQGDPAPRPSRRTFDPEYKLAILAEYEQAPNGQKGAILRREGLYSSHVIEWARARDAGALPGPATGGDTGTANPSRPAKKTAEHIELEKLRRQNAKLQSELNKTRIALDIMGKAHALLEEISESADNETPPTR